MQLQFFTTGMRKRARGHLGASLWRISGGDDIGISCDTRRSSCLDHGKLSHVCLEGYGEDSTYVLLKHS